MQEVPEVFVAWWTRHASSNVDLANLSNVNRQWRSIVVNVLLEQAEEDQEQGSTSLLLLLPSMIRATLTATTTTTSISQQNEKDTFCAAWFHPAGIQIQQLGSSVGEVWDMEGEDTTFTPSGVPSYRASDEGERRFRNFSSASRGRSLLRRHEEQQQEEGTLCSQEWQGYRHPMDVLEPFGYAEHFVQTVLSEARARSSRESNDVGNEETQQEEDENHSHSLLTETRRLDVQATIAVRGATLARPEGFCLCWDSSDATAVASTSHTNDGWKAESHDGYLRAMMVRKRKRQILQREVLPRVLLSSKHKNPLNLDMNSKQQPCLQFLNATGSNAVRLFTPPFECGPLEGPITLFLVGIATEDGCFVSGLKHRCELGHMHPLNLRDAMIDMSPVCIATDYQRMHPQRSGSPSESMFASRSRSLSGRSGGDSGADSDDSSCALDTSREDGGVQCKCEFNDDVTQSWEEQDEEPPEECVYRGQRGPGLWHCYVCVFDKEDSVIRIDGSTEPLETGCCQDSPPAAIMDGLTIGSDHCFDMSLCLGDASIEEGEGAISELLVFKGRLPDSDIEQLEEYLMRKHGIAKPKPTERASLVREDEWKRQGRALIAQPPPWSMRVPSGVPLPIMARDRDVSWHRTNVVTGKDVRVSRIGSKYSHGSSDW